MTGFFQPHHQIAESLLATAARRTAGGLFEDGSTRQRRPMPVALRRERLVGWWSGDAYGALISQGGKEL